jgi:UDPglucose 6-dehydrogenase
MREASSRVLMEGLWERGAHVQAFDPAAAHETQRIYGNHSQLTLVDTPEAALAGADVLAIVTEWKVFRSPDFAVIKASLKQPVIFDGRNLYEPAQMRELGFEYFAIGRK